MKFVSSACRCVLTWLFLLLVFGFPAIATGFVLAVWFAGKFGFETFGQDLLFAGLMVVGGAMYLVDMVF